MPTGIPGKLSPVISTGIIRNSSRMPDGFISRIPYVVHPDTYPWIPPGILLGFYPICPSEVTSSSVIVKSALVFKVSKLQLPLYWHAFKEMTLISPLKRFSEQFLQKLIYNLITQSAEQ